MVKKVKLQHCPQNNKKVLTMMSFCFCFPFLLFFFFLLSYSSLFTLEEGVGLLVQYGTFKILFFGYVLLDIGMFG